MAGIMANQKLKTLPQVQTSEVNRLAVMRKFISTLERDRTSWHGGSGSYVEDVLPWVQSVKASQSLLVDTRISIGFYLLQIYKLRVTAFEGYQYGTYYDTFMTFCEKEFGFSKTKVSNLICCALKYSEYNEKGEPTERLAPEFREYSYSQLVEMLPLENVLPATYTVKAIREEKAAQAQAQFAIEKERAYSRIEQFSCSYTDCRKILACDLAVGDVMIITETTRVVVTEVKKTDKRVTYVTGPAPDGYPQQYMGNLEPFDCKWLSTRPLENLVQTSDPALASVSDLNGVPSDIEYLPVLTESLSVGYEHGKCVPLVSSASDNIYELSNETYTEESDTDEDELTESEMRVCELEEELCRLRAEFSIYQTALSLALKHKYEDIERFLEKAREEKNKSSFSF